MRRLAVAAARSPAAHDPIAPPDRAVDQDAEHHVRDRRGSARARMAARVRASRAIGHEQMLSQACPLAIAAEPLYGSAMNKILVLALALTASCGPSSSELKTARDTTYNGPPATLFAAAKGAITGTRYKIKLEDPDGMKLATEPVSEPLTLSRGRSSSRRW